MFLFFMLLALPCALALAIGVAELPAHTATGLFLIAPILVWGFAMLKFVSPYTSALEVQERQAEWQRTEEIVERLEMGERMELRGWFPLIPGLLLSPVALLALGAGLLDSMWPAVAIASVLLVYGVALLLRGLPCIGRPMAPAAPGACT